MIWTRDFWKNFFGFEIRPLNQERSEKEQELIPAITPREEDDGSTIIESAGFHINLEGTIKNEGQLISKYREMAMQNECDYAIDDICNEAITRHEAEKIVDIELDHIEILSESMKEKIRTEFQYILKLLNFHNLAYDIFRKWYIDGRLFYHIMINVKKPRQGIKEVRYIDPRKIIKVKEPKETTMAKIPGLNMNIEFKEYFKYNPFGLESTLVQSINIAKNSICHVTSGMVNKNNNMVLSHLHKAIKPLNQLRMLEDAIIIYRLARAPERRIFYIDVGNLPKIKAEQYLKNMMVKHKNKIIYDASTGEMKNDQKYMNMLEDFWLPRREGGRGTEISTLPGGENLSALEDVEYFKQKLYKSLNIPVSRLDHEQQFNLGRASEISRDELKFNKFIHRLRTKFCDLFLTLLGVQLTLKGIMSAKDWKRLQYQIFFNFLEDNHFTELKFLEIFENRINALNNAEPHIGKFFSHIGIKRDVLRMSEEEIKQLDEELDEEKKQGLHGDEDDEFGGGDDDFGGGGNFGNDDDNEEDDDDEKDNDNQDKPPSNGNDNGDEKTPDKKDDDEEDDKKKKKPPWLNKN